MFTAFQNGQIDITDWPIGSAADLSTFQNNPDLYVTGPVNEIDYTKLDILSHHSFMGISLTTPRSPIPPAFLTGQSTPACSTGFGSLMITLQNQETGQTILDPLSTIKAANQPSGFPSTTISDQGGPTPNGNYQTQCLLAGTYSLTNNIYNATGSTATISSGQTTQGVLKVNYNSISNVYPSAARSELGAALAHMIDKASFSTGFSGTRWTPIDIMVTVPAGGTQFTQAQINAAECQFNNHPWLNVCNGTGNDVSAYNIANDSVRAGSEWWQTAGAAISVGLGYSGHDDLRAACDDLVSIGLQLYPIGGTCDDVANAAVGTIQPTSYPHITPRGNIIEYIRTDAVRKQYGTIIADTLNFLFGTPSSSAGNHTVCYGPCPQFTPTYYRISQVICVFQLTCDFDFYTGIIDPIFLDDFIIWNSRFAEYGLCGGPNIGLSVNFVVYCNPAFDSDTSAGFLTNNVTLANRLFSRASNTALLTSISIPVLTPIVRFAEMNGWNFQQCNGTPCVATQSSIVNTVADGTQFGYWTLLNARQVPGYDPCTALGAPANCSSFSPGGGDPTLIRRGFTQDTGFLSPFIASTVWEFEIISQIFDSMLQSNPLTGGSTGQLIDWGTTSHSSTFDTATGVTTQLWHLRNDLKFQDGNPVTANDVAYTIIANRDVPSQLAYAVFQVISAVGIDCGTGQPCTILQVKLQGGSPDNEFNIGTLPILEKKLWAPICGDPVSTDPNHPSNCANPAFDPMAAGIMVGDGPWSCAIPAGFANAGHVGGSCFVNPDGTLGGQSSSPGGKWLLTRNSLFDRCCPDDTSSSLYKLSWADKNNDGVVNILDLADAAVHFGTPDPYWLNSNIAQGTYVNIQDLATVAFYFGHGTTFPFKPSQLTGVDPQIDPFFCPNTGC